MANPAPNTPKPITLEWGDITELPLKVADNMHYRTMADRCYLTIGQMNIPVRGGPLPDGYEIAVRPLARFVLTPQTLRTWATLLNEAVAQFDAPKTPK